MTSRAYMKTYDMMGDMAEEILKHHPQTPFVTELLSEIEKKPKWGKVELKMMIIKILILKK